MLNFEQIFKVTNTPYAVIDPAGFRILTANQAFLGEITQDRSAVIGKRFEDFFASQSTSTDKRGFVATLSESFRRVVETRQVDEIPLCHYPYPNAPEERFSSVVNAPVLDDDGRVACILHSVSDVTALVAARRERGEAFEIRRSLANRANQMEELITRRTEETWQLNEQLKIAQRVGNMGSWQWTSSDQSPVLSDELYRLLGLRRTAGEVPKEQLKALVYPEDREWVDEAVKRILAGEDLPADFEYRIVRPEDGKVRFVRNRIEGKFDDSGDLVALYGTVQDITEHYFITEEMTKRARQQAAVANLGQFALQETDLLKLYDAAVKSVAEVLDVEYCKVLQLLPSENMVKLVAGVGWQEGLVGKAKVDIGPNSQAGFTLLSDRPVIVEDLRTERRFNGPPLLLEHKVVSGLSVIIHGEDRPWGVLGAHTIHKRNFDNNDVSYFQSVANILAEAIRRNTAEKRREHSEHRTHQILDSALDAVVAIDHDSRVVEWNPQAREIFGWDREEAVGHPIYDLIIPEEYRQAHREGMQKYLTGGEGPLLNRRVEVPALRRDGSRFPAELAITPIETDGTIQFSAFLRDIGARKRAENQVRESEERFRLVSKATADVIWDWDLKANTIWWNDGLARIFGYEDVETPTSSEFFISRILPDDRDKVRRLIEDAMRPETQDEWQVDCEFQCSDGTCADVVLRGYVVRDADRNVTRMLGGINDVSESKRKERRLAEQADLLDKARDAIIVRDMEHRIRYWNRGAERIYGWKAKEALGKRIDELLHADQAVFDGAVAALRKSGEWSGEARLQRKDGSIAVCEVSWTLVRNEAGEPVSVMSINTDITQQKGLEAQLLQSQRLETVGQLTGGVAHDFNNLLTVIMGNAELIVERQPEDGGLNKLALMIRDAAQRGSELTHALLAFSRRQALEPRTVNINRLVSDIESLFRRVLPENIDLQVRHGEDLWNASVDPAQLESVLLNLVLNARDAMATGGGLTVETANVRLDEDYAAQHAEVTAGDYVMLAVSDTGAGIPPEVLDRVFEPFFTTKKEGKGSGLGLSMAYGFVKQSNGHIKIYSEQNQGTTIKIYLPRAASEEDAPKAEEQVEMGQGERILVVEDNELVRDYAENQLLAIGYEVVSAASGPEALKVIEQDKDIDLLFTDVIMSGGMNGPELVVHARQVIPELKVLYTSGYTENAIVHHGRLDEGVQLLQKPYNRQELTRRIRMALSD